MLIITSPAKTQDFESDWTSDSTSTPIFLDEAHQLHQQLQQMSEPELMDLMDISENLAELNYKRFKKWDKTHDADNSKPAILAYKGDIYKQISADDYSPAQQAYLQSSLRIISGFYGLLKPYDLMQAYRLEMKTKLNVGDAADLYEFWGDKLTEQLNEDADHMNYSYLVDLASNEYAKAINYDKLQPKVVKVEFRQKKEEELHNYGIYAKKARGKVIEFMTNNNVKTVDQLADFNLGGYKLHERDSDRMLTFVKPLD